MIFLYKLQVKDSGTGGTTNTGNWPHSGKATPITTGHLTPADRHGSVQVGDEWK